jgi:hypothetical protein
MSSIATSICNLLIDSSTYIILNRNGKGQTNIDNERKMIVGGFISPGSAGAILMSLKLEKIK